MYGYLISYGDENLEDYEEIELLHEKKFTKDEFNEMCFNILTDNLDEIMNDEYLSNGIDFISEKLKNEYGFLKAKYFVAYHDFGMDGDYQ